MICSKLFVCAALAVTAMWHASAAAAVIPVTNHSFQDPVVPDDANPNDEDPIDTDPGSPTGWTFRYTQNAPATVSWGVAQPATAHYGNSVVGTNNPLPAPFDLDQVGFINLNNADPNTIAEADSDPVGALQAGGIYKLNVAVGARNTTSWSIIKYDIGLVAGGGELGTFATVSMEPGTAPTFITDLQYTLDVNSQAAAFIGQPVSIRIRAENTNLGGASPPDFAQANFDNVRLNLVPEPASVLLTGMGCLIVLGWSRQRA